MFYLLLPSHLPPPHTQTYKTLLTHTHWLAERKAVTVSTGSGTVCVWWRPINYITTTTTIQKTLMMRGGKTGHWIKFNIHWNIILLPPHHHHHYEKRQLSEGQKRGRGEKEEGGEQNRINYQHFHNNVKRCQKIFFVFFSRGSQNRCPTMNIVKNNREFKRKEFLHVNEWRFIGKNSIGTYLFRLDHTAALSHWCDKLCWNPSWIIVARWNRVRKTITSTCVCGYIKLNTTTDFDTLRMA